MPNAKAVAEGATWPEFLQTWDLIPDNHLGHPEAERIVAEAKSLISEFVEKVYNKGLRSKIDQSNEKELVDVFGNVRVNTYVLRGRVYVYFRSLDRYPEDKIVFLADEDGDPDMVLSDIEATTFEDAKKMVETVINEWRKSCFDKMRKVRNKQEAIPDGCNS